MCCNPSNQYSLLAFTPRTFPASLQVIPQVPNTVNFPGISLLARMLPTFTGKPSECAFTFGLVHLHNCEIVEWAHLNTQIRISSWTLAHSKPCSWLWCGRLPSFNTSQTHNTVCSEQCINNISNKNSVVNKRSHLNTNRSAHAAFCASGEILFSLRGERNGIT